MKIVNFRMKTEALETVRNPPFRELRKKLAAYLSSWSEVLRGHCQSHLCLSRWNLIIPKVPSLCLWMRTSDGPQLVSGYQSR